MQRTEGCLAGLVQEGIRGGLNLLLRHKVEFARWRRGEEAFPAEGVAYAEAGRYENLIAIIMDPGEDEKLPSHL